MKSKLSLSIVFMLICSVLLANSTMSKSDINSENVTEFSENEIYSAFNEIEEELEYISSNEDVTYDELIEKEFYSSNISNATTVAMNLQDNGEEPPVLGSFLWGCLFGPIGIVVVAITTDNNKEQLKKSIWGCAVPTGCTILSYVFYFVAYAATASTYY